jgi:tRNA (guanine37-N1)-methyltransferase
MIISILTLFPEMFVGPFDHSIIKRAKEKQAVEIRIINIRDFGIGPHKMVDDKPYGGGVGMVLRVDVLHKAIESSLLKDIPRNQQKVVLMEASGKQYSQKKAHEYIALKHLILICGHYEGVDARIKEYIDEEISVGPYVVTGGELPAMLITDSITRLLPGVLKEDATKFESFSHGLDSALEYPQYTRPPVYENKTVPQTLTSGDHKKIAQWKEEQTRKG